MAYRKGRKRRSYRRKSNRRYNRRRKGVKQNVHFFKRHVDLGRVDGSGSGGEGFGSLFFRLSDVPNFSEFTSLYDAFKIAAVKVFFIPISNVTFAEGASNAQAIWSTHYYRLLSAIDYNDDTPVNMAALREYQNCKMTPNNVIHKRFLKPKALTTIDEDSGSGSNYTYAETSTNPWISTAGNQCRWFGLKFGFEQQTNDSNPRYRIEAVYYLQFKSRK